MNRQKIKAFTLVELIVVITILAILGTIAFIALQGYSRDARDSTRISDINSIKISLELFKVDTGKYPIPTEPTEVTYSGATAWNQGTVGDSVIENLQKMEKKPVDPLTGTEYAYSATNTRKEYQLGSILEGDLMGSSLVTQTYAADKSYAYVEGTYNEKVLKVSTGGIDYILAVPSILYSEYQLGWTIQDLINNFKLVFNGYNNLPASYNGTSFDLNGGFNFVPSDDILIYSGSISNLENQSDQVVFIKNLQNVYKGTILENYDNYYELSNISIDTGNPSNETLAVAAININYCLGLDLPVVDYVSSLNNTGGGTGGGGELGLTQEEVDELNTLTSQSLTIEEWQAVTTLDLSNNTLTDIPAGVLDLTNLITLDLSGNSITELAIALTETTSLTTLNLSNNNLSTLPSDLVNLTNLTNLNLSGNPSLGSLSANFDENSSNVSQSGIPSSNTTMHIIGRVITGGTGIEIDVTNNGSFAFIDGSYGTTTLGGNDIMDIMVASNGDTWFATYGNGVSRLTSGGTWYRYSTTNGLIGNEVKTIIESSDGKIRLGGWNGISYLSGSIWYTSNYATQVNVLFEDSSGDIWTGNGASIVNFELGNTNSGTTYTTADGLLAGYFETIDQNIATGELRFGGNSGIVKTTNGTSWDSTTITSLLGANTSINGICYMDSHIWTVSSSGGVRIFNGNTLVRSHTDMPTNFQYGHKCSVNSSGTEIIVGSFGDEIYAGEPGTLNMEKPIRSNLFLGNGKELTPYFANNGDFWLGTRTGWGAKGVKKFAGGISGTETHYISLGAPFDALTIINNIFTDSSGNIWYAVDGAGVVKYNGTTWVEYNTGNSGLADDFTRVISQDGNGNIWIGTDYGVSKFDGVSTWTTPDTDLNFPTAPVYSLVHDNTGSTNVMWFATDGAGLTRYNVATDTWDYYDSGNSTLPSDFLGSVFVDQVGSVWVGTSDSGVHKFNTATTYNTGNSVLPADAVWFIDQDSNGNMWFMTDLGVAKLSGGTIYDFPGLPADFGTVKVDSSGNVWLGFVDILYRLSGENTWSIFDSDITGYIYTIEEDNSGNIWIGTDAGVYKYCESCVNKTWIRTINTYCQNESLGLVPSCSSIGQSIMEGGLCSYNGYCYESELKPSCSVNTTAKYEWVRYSCK